MELFRLTDKIAIVTGGNQGIGFAIAKGLAMAGATVVIANRRAAEGQQAAETIRQEGNDATAIATDISDRTSVDRMVSEVIAKYKRIDILVNNAGVIVRKPLEEISEEDWNYIFDINLKGMFFCSQSVGKEMIKKKKGKIINISSNVSEVVMPGRAIYSVSKAGVAHLTRALALEWAKYNINVNALGPGPTITDINKKYFDEHPEDLKARIDSIPLARIGQPMDHVGAAIFLASGASDFVTGQNLLVDGGSTIW
ncbi:MAG: glucose 1-dehydrogenase [Deltaproteobacteria bacterium]|nr:glucose 1-dehydrogenase [Deltaproteobacteria bacterium]MBW2153735.1 glucose 1-dehydrogenase [Deltaproteobacteria bacterium]